MLRRGAVFCILFGVVLGCILGGWMVWQHDALVEFASTPSILLRVVAIVVCFGAVSGWGLGWCAERSSGLAGLCLWVPVFVGLLASVGVCLFWSFASLTAASPKLISMVLLIFAAPAMMTAGVRIKMTA